MGSGLCKPRDLKMKPVVLLTILLQSCAPTQVLLLPPPFVVERALWVKCWEACGKADKLKSVDRNYCLCTNATKFEHSDRPLKIEIEDE